MICLKRLAGAWPRWTPSRAGLKDSIKVLREAGTQEKNISHCVVWVRRFFARHQDHRRRDLGRTEIEAFLAETTLARKIYNGSFSVGWQQVFMDFPEIYHKIG